MIEHVSNCHGEWNFLLVAIGSIPFVGAWLRYHIQKLRNQKVLDEQINENR